MSDRVKKAVRIAWILVVLATLTFIFVQSTLSSEESQKESDKVSDIIEEIIPPETDAGAFVQDNVRKIAHFVEFAVLGGEVALYMLVYHRKLKATLTALAGGLLMALFDETIQIFSKRGSSVSDVWLDFAGFMTASLICYTVYGVILLFLKYANKGLQNQNREDGNV